MTRFPAYFLFMASLPIYVLSLQYGATFWVGVSGFGLGWALLWMTER